MTETERVNELRGNDSALYAELMRISKEIIPAYLGKKGLRLPLQSREELAHDSVARLMERINRRGAEYKISFIRPVLRKEYTHQLHDPKRVRYEKSAAEITGDVEERRESKVLDDDGEYFRELLFEPDGQSIICIIYFSKSFKTAVLSLAEKMGRKWVYDNAKAIRSVWKNTRVKGGAGRERLPSGLKQRQQVTRLSELKSTRTLKSMTGATDGKSRR